MHSTTLWDLTLLFIGILILFNKNLIRWAIIKWRKKCTNAVSKTICVFLLTICRLTLSKTVTQAQSIEHFSIFRMLEKQKLVETLNFFFEDFPSKIAVAVCIIEKYLLGLSITWQSSIETTKKIFFSTKFDDQIYGWNSWWL